MKFIEKEHCDITLRDTDWADLFVRIFTSRWPFFSAMLPEKVTLKLEEPTVWHQKLNCMKDK